MRRLTTGLKKTFRVLFLATSFFLIRLSYDTIRNNNDTIDFKPLVEKSFARAEISSARRYLDARMWPTYQGYDDRFATEETTPIDVSLAERITLAESFMNTPRLRLKKREAVTDSKFEKIVHQTWRDENITAEAASWVSVWLKMNPGWKHMFWTDVSQRRFIKNQFPPLLDVYDSWTFPVQRSDMFRYVALYAFGGVYADLDIQVLKPLEEVRDWGTCVLSREPDPQVFIMYPPLASWANNYTFTGNAFLACRSHHPFLHYLLGRVVQNSPLIRGSPCLLERTILCTGPWLVSFAYSFYKRSISDDLRQEERDWDVICPRYDLFLPTYDPSRQWLLKTSCFFLRFFGTTVQREICAKARERDFRNLPSDSSFTNHLWFSSYHNEYDGKVDVRSVASVSLWSRERDRQQFQLCRQDGCREVR